MAPRWGPSQKGHGRIMISYIFGARAGASRALAGQVWFQSNLGLQSAQPVHGQSGQTNGDKHIVHPKAACLRGISWEPSMSLLVPY